MAKQRRDVRPELVAFGCQLRQLRKGLGLSQEQLANKAGISRVYISSAETGRRDAKLTTIYKIAAALEIDPGDLVRGTAPPLASTTAGC